MFTRTKISLIKVALSIMSATFVYGCEGGMKGDIVINGTDKIPTVTTINHTINNTADGVREYKFITPLMERYEMVEEPYMEFRKGIHIETYDSTKAVSSELVADYAIYNESKKLWETKGNVVGNNADGDKIFTEQLFWDEKTDRIYSDVDTKIIKGNDIIIGSSFTSDGELKNIEYRQTKGLMYVDTTKTSQPDTLNKESFQPADSINN